MPKNNNIKEISFASMSSNPVLLPTNEGVSLYLITGDTALNETTEHLVISPSGVVVQGMEYKIAIPGNVTIGTFGIEVFGRVLTVSEAANPIVIICIYNGTTWDVDVHNSVASSGGGTTDYNALTNKPNVNDLSVSGDLDLGTNKALYSNVYAQLADLPSASSYHGMFAHVHATGSAYFAHDGAWVELAKNSDLGGGGTSDFLQLTNVPNIAILENNKVGFSDTVTVSETSVAYIDVLSEDFGGGAWSGNVSGSGLRNTMGWTQATATEVTGQLDANGRQYYNLVDNLTGNGQSNWPVMNGAIGSVIPQGTVQELSFSIRKASLVKPLIVFISSNSSLGFLDQPLFEIDSTGTVTEGANSGTICPNGMTRVDNGNHWEYSLDILGSPSRQFGVLPVLRDVDGGGYASQSSGSVDITAPYIKTGNVAGVVTTTTTTTLNKLEVKHITPSILANRGRLTAPNEVAFAIVMGQSNAAGLNTGVSPATVDIDCVYTMAAGDYVWRPYQNNNSNIYSSNGSNKSNPLTEMAREWQVRKDADPTLPDLYIINCSYSGTGFDYSLTSSSQWDPFMRRNGNVTYELPEIGVSNTNKSLFWTAQKAIKEGLLQFAMSGRKAYHIGTIWNQWESDGVSTAAINRYPANLQLIRKMVDQELGLIDADFYAWRPQNQRASLPTMQSHFDNFAADNNNAFLINTQDMSEYTGVSPNFGVFENDNIHYTPAVQVKAVKFVLDNGYFSADAGGNSTRRAREVVMNATDLVTTMKMDNNGIVRDIKTTTTGTHLASVTDAQL